MYTQRFVVISGDIIVMIPVQLVARDSHIFEHSQCLRENFMNARTCVRHTFIWVCTVHLCSSIAFTVMLAQNEWGQRHGVRIWAKRSGKYAMTVDWHFFLSSRDREKYSTLFSICKFMRRLYFCQSVAPKSNSQKHRLRTVQKKKHFWLNFDWKLMTPNDWTYVWPEKLSFSHLFLACSIAF